MSLFTPHRFIWAAALFGPVLHGCAEDASLQFSFDLPDQQVQRMELAIYEGGCPGLDETREPVAQWGYDVVGEGNSRSPSPDASGGASIGAGSYGVAVWGRDLDCQWTYYACVEFSLPSSDGTVNVALMPTSAPSDSCPSCSLDECTPRCDVCAPTASCATSVDEVFCTCPDGYKGDGKGTDGCVDLNECDLVPSVCASGERCQNTEGSHTCSDIDECGLQPRVCAPAATCENTSGGYTCTCNGNYRGDGKGPDGCIDVDECVADPDACSPDATCMNTAGGYTCTCNGSYKGDGRGPDGCIDIDECAVDPQACYPGATCENTAGDYTCACPAGFEARGESQGKGANGCIDINECEGPSRRCATDEGTLCTNTPGGFSCQCKPGFLGSGAPGQGCAPVLEDLTVSEGQLTPGFRPDVTEYVLQAGLTQSSLDITSSWEGGHQVFVADTLATSNEAVTQALPLGRSALPVQVRTGDTRRTYTVAVDRGAAMYLKAASPQELSGFGGGLAISADGNTLAVAAVLDSSCARGIDGDPTGKGCGFSGAVFVFRRTGDSWLQQAYLKASNTGESDLFGTSLAISADGSSLFVGAPSEASCSADQSDNGCRNAGAVYAFERDASAEWKQTAYLKAQTPSTASDFGASLAVSDDGQTLAVGAPRTQHCPTVDTCVDAGAVHVLEADGATFRQSLLRPTNPEAGDQFGAALSLGSTGSTLAVGAPDDNNCTSRDGEPGDSDCTDAGAAYVFDHVGGAWTNREFVKAPTVLAGAHFGAAVALNGHNDVLVVSAPNEPGCPDALPGERQCDGGGAAYVYRRAGSWWSIPTRVRASNRATPAKFGEALRLNHAGDTLVIAAPGDRGCGRFPDANGANQECERAGAAYLFAMDDEQAWTQRAYLKATNTARAFGSGITMSAGGETIVVGAEDENGCAAGVGGDPDDVGCPFTGAAYVFE